MAQKLFLTRTSRAVLAALARSPDSELYGQSVCREAGLASGTVYPLLDRLGELGWVASRWESDDDPPRATGPRRRYWRLTEDGRRHAAAVLAVTDKRPVLKSLNGESHARDHQA